MNTPLGQKRLAITVKNRCAVQAATSLVTDDHPRFDLLVIQGDGGRGKTHLLRTVEVMQRTLHPQANTTFLNAGELLRWPAIVDDIALFGIDLLLVDDIDLLLKHATAQEALLHCIDTVQKLALGRIIVTSSLSVRDMAPALAPRLVSRLYGAGSATIDPADLEMRTEMIHAELEQWDGFDLSAHRIDYLARKLPSDGHMITGAIRRLALHVLTHGTDLTPVEIDRILDRTFDTSKRIAISTIQERTSAHFHIPQREMVSQRRAREVARPRQVSMYLSKMLTPKSLPDIGRLHGKRDHTTVIHAVRQIERLRATDSDLDASIRLIERELTH